MKKVILTTIGILFIGFNSINVANAHVTVQPKEVKISAYQNFTVSIPVEKNIPTTQIRLIIPEGLESVRPNVKQGWNIELKKENDETAGEEASKINEIIWKDGKILADLRDEFIFSAKTPAEDKTLQWKAYQTYEDGSTVSWDLDPKAEQPKDAEGKPDFSKFGPLSETQIIDDLAPKSSSASESDNSFPTIISFTALVLSTAALALSFRKPRL